MKQTLADMRRDYTLAELSRQSVAADPFQQFGHWFQEAQNAQVFEANAMSLATADNNARPSVRVVLLKGFDESGFIFYTNYQSEKGQELAQNPHAAAVFFWRELERQVRISGRVEKVTKALSQEYFHSRPPASQIGALASNQSQVVANRDILDERFQILAEKYRDQTIPLPDYWGGYRIIPSEFEFWQGRSSRLHDRLRYRRSGSNVDWAIERLEP